MQDFSRQIIIFSGSSHWKIEQQLKIIQHYQHYHGVYCGYQLPQYTQDSLSCYAFQQSRNILGQEFQFAIFDATVEKDIAFHLDSLLILSATLQAGGALFLFIPEWHKLDECIDFDSERWNNGQRPHTVPHFMNWFKQTVAWQQIVVYQENGSEIILPQLTSANWHIPPSAIKHQQAVLMQLAQQPNGILLLSARRGRGKSALLGQLIQQQSQTANILITAANKKAVTTVAKFALPQKLNFIAPDELLQKIKQKQFNNNEFLIVDEAAMLPLSSLALFSNAFSKVLLTSTSEGYEGSGKGFILKLQGYLKRKIHFFDLDIPLRWQQNDRLEQWMDQLALVAQNISNIPYQNSKPKFNVYNTLPINFPFAELYQLLNLSHYRTSPTDLRRLMDGTNQYFITVEIAERIIGVVWCLEEGGFCDEKLVEQIRLGYRRPKGNLVAQALCFQTNLSQALTLRSVRISRIAVLPQYQHQTLGTQLIQQCIQKYQHHVDYLSVSFGFETSLFRFWKELGFQLSAVSVKPEASSGNYSVMMIYPLSTAGTVFCQQAVNRFQRDFILSEHPLLTKLDSQVETDWHLNSEDWQFIDEFIQYQRTLAVSYAALRRLFHYYPNDNLEKQLKQFKGLFFTQKKLKTTIFKQQLEHFLANKNKKI
ncbi:GNAT family N-acetyltransferase [Gallibacterium sp. ZY190522]